MKHIFILFLSFFVFPVFAVTSKSYVDSAVALLQDEIPAINTNIVLTNTGTAGEIGIKQIYDESTDYALQQNALVTAETFNAAVQNAIDNEFVCIEASADGCLLYKTQINTLPSGYTRLEYLESTGTQYIDSGILATNNTGAFIRYAFTQFHSYAYIFGSQYPHFYFGITSDGQHMAASYGQSVGNVVASVPVANIQTNTIYSANMNLYNSHIVEFVGLTDARQMADKTFAATKNTLRIFGGAAHYSSVRIYSVKITEGIAMVRNFIPARRNSDGELGMYDTITNTFFANAGADSFVAGAPVDSSVYLSDGAGAI